VCAADWKAPEWQRLPSGDAKLDALLGGGWVVPSAALVWARPKTGKSRLVFRWATHMGPALVVEKEMSLDLTIATARSAGADLRLLHIRLDLDGWQADAEALGARVVVFDSIQACTRWPLALLREAYAWAQRRRVVVFAISQVNSSGRPLGPIALEHWPDYPVRITRRNQKSTIATVAFPQGSRFCGPGSVQLPIA
jgi:predicted ATP-dependent serine protease